MPEVTATNGANGDSADRKPVKVAVVQAESEWLDLDAGVKKTCKFIEEAAKNGARLVAFPECWIPGYPAWIWSRGVDPPTTAKYIKNSLAIDSPQMRTIQACAKENEIAVVLGFSENDKNSLYIAQAIISEDGEIKTRRRKMKPTHMERTIFGDASGDNCLDNVAQLGKGVGRVGSLACWEHTQPLLKYHTASQNEEIHVAAWPPVYPHEGKPVLWSMSREGCRNLSQTYAIETQTFVLHSTAVVGENGIKVMDLAGSPLFGGPGGGSSAIFAPDGRQISEDIPQTDDGLIYGELHFDMVLGAKSFLDICGHYSRPDMLWLGVDRREKKHVFKGS